LRRTLSTVGAMTLLFLASSNLATASEYSAPGGYLVVAGLDAFEVFTGSSGADWDNSLGFEVRGGYRVMDYLAAEIEGNFITGFDGEITTANGDIKTLSSESWTITVNAKGIYPLGRFEPYAIVGIGAMWSNLVTGDYVDDDCTVGFLGWWCDNPQELQGKKSVFVAKFGAGTDFWVLDDVALTLDAVYVLPTGDLKEQTYIKLGWGFKFRF
jgi:hypothetical protein